MFTHLSKTVLAAFALSVAVAAYADPGKVDLEAAEMAAELIGAPDFAKGGQGIRVARRGHQADGRPLQVTMKTVARSARWGAPLP